MTADTFLSALPQATDEQIDSAAHKIAEWMTRTEATRPRSPFPERTPTSCSSGRCRIVVEPAVTFADDADMERANAERSANKRDMMRGQR